MEKMDRAAVKVLAAATQKALEAVAAEHGVTVEVRGGSYDPAVGTFKPKVSFALANAAEAEFERWATVYGLEVSDYGREFTTHGRRFRITGIAPRSRVRPVLCDEVGTDRTFKFAADSVKAWLVSPP
jgi:hypothetical protein